MSAGGDAILTLYFAPGSSSLAAHLALAEAGAEYALHFVDEDAGEQRTEAYLRVNPRGKVPALRLPDGSVLVENIAIQTSVARTHPEARLLPEDPAGEARALSLMAFFASAVHPAFAHLYAPQRFTGVAAGEAGIRARARETFLAHCREIDALLAGREWFLDAFSVVDCYGFIFYDWGRRAGLPVEGLRHYAAHQARMKARPAVQRALEREREASGR
jgi:glutathione S-transferase